MADFKVMQSWRTGKIFPRPTRKKLEKLIIAAANAAGLDKYDGKALSVSFLSSKKMAEVNWDFLRHKGDTDVICFDYGADLEDAENEVFPGAELEVPVSVELLICPEVALRSARKRGLEFSFELTLYLAHGLLHAAGYDDLQPKLKRRMRAAERRVMNSLQAEFKLSEIFKEA